jgi:diacylglycerol kinase family enzyme
LKRAAERLTQSEAKRIALGRFSNAQIQRYFVLMGGVGFDASVVLQVNAKLKAMTGKFAYWAAGFAKTFGTVEQFEARVNGSIPEMRKQAGFVLVSRVRNYGGDMEIARTASLLRDDFQVVMFEGALALRYASYLLGVRANALKLMPGVTDLHTGCVECSADVPVQLDGEYVGRTPGRFEIVPDALTVLLPAAYR